nr:MAG TPA: hypothetical protein [Caudoviricetes sp.]
MYLDYMLYMTSSSNPQSLELYNNQSPRLYL